MRSVINVAVSVTISAFCLCCRCWCNCCGTWCLL